MDQAEQVQYLVSAGVDKENATEIVANVVRRKARIDAGNTHLQVLYLALLESSHRVQPLLDALISDGTELDRANPDIVDYLECSRALDEYEARLDALDTPSS